MTETREAMIKRLRMRSMRRESFPEFELDRILITVPYPGAAPQEVEEGIGQKIEEAVRDAREAGTLPEGPLKAKVVTREAIAFDTATPSAPSASALAMSNEVTSLPDAPSRTRSRKPAPRSVLCTTVVILMSKIEHSRTCPTEPGIDSSKSVCIV